jgi:ABC-type multidrug transport system fused ATPase/permease subunit
LFVVEKGRLAESGTHRDLLAKPNGIYRKLYELQLQLQ